MGLALEQMTSNEWHVLKGETQYGPYSYEELIRMMQTNLVFGYDYAWSPHLDSWTPIADLEEFSAVRLARLVENNRNQDVFSQRVHERVLCKIPCYATDQQTLWEGQVENLSEGGALVLMKNPTLLPGGMITIHFRTESASDCAFNATAEILTKRLVKQKIHHDTGIHYAVRFINKSPAGTEQIKKWLINLKDKKLA
jgi:hypothetical protein